MANRFQKEKQSNRKACLATGQSMPERKMFFDGGGKTKPPSQTFLWRELGRRGLLLIYLACSAIVYDSAVSPYNPAFRGNSLTGKPQAVEKYPQSLLHPEAGPLCPVMPYRTGQPPARFSSPGQRRRWTTSQAVAPVGPHASAARQPAWPWRKAPN